ncbi:MAG: polysaccharide deacetylase family protein [Thermaurantimonas sp.]|uniref:polysaccharide deacetylase family protein n=1 Tax=Thermaurantimonas sp. TaxID=2681568 RepID=UPI003918AB34
MTMSILKRYKKYKSMKKCVQISLTICFLFFQNLCLSNNLIILKIDSYHNKHPLRQDSIKLKNLITSKDTTIYFPKNIFELLVKSKKENPEVVIPENKIVVSQNPYRQVTKIGFKIPRKIRVSVSITDMSGRTLAVDRFMSESGTHFYEVAGGKNNVYIIHVQMGTRILSEKFLGLSDMKNIYLKKIEEEETEEDEPRTFFEIDETDSLQITSYATDLDGNPFINEKIIHPNESQIIRFDKFSTYKCLVLMYHKITPGPANDTYERAISDFINDLNYIKNKGYKVIPIEMLDDIYKGNLGLPGNSIVITFDDGFTSDFTLAAPALKQRNMPATFFIVPGWISSEPGYMTWAQVWLLSQEKDSSNRNLFHIGSHSMTHSFLLDMSSQMTPQQYQAFLDYEFGISAAEIKDVTGQQKLFFSLPFGNGANNLQIINTAKKFSYNGIRTSIWNSFTESDLNIWVIPSLPILDFTDIKIIDDYFK